MQTIFTLALALLVAGPALAQQNQQQNGSATVTIKKGRVSHNDVRSGVKGLTLHHEVKTTGLKGEQLEVSCYFRYDDAAGKPLLDSNGKFNTPSGKVSVSSRETVKFAESNFKDFQHFMPYNELHLGPGKTKIKVRCQAFKNSNLLGKSDWLRVTFTSGPKAKAKAKPTAVFTKPKMVHNVIKAGIKGLGLRHHLRVQHMKGKKIEVTCHFKYKASGKSVRDTNGKYRTKSGNVSVSDTVTAKFDDSSWKTFKHFIPYNELHITAKGKTQLKTRCEAYDGGTSIGAGPWQFLDFNK